MKIIKILLTKSIQISIIKIAKMELATPELNAMPA